MRMTFVKVFIVLLLLLHRTFCLNDGDLRVSGGRNSREGRLEIYHNGEWGTVCDDAFDNLDAFVACRQLTNRSVKTATFYTAGGGTGNILLDNLACKGTEWKLSMCSNEGWNNHNCNHGEDVGIRCSVEDSGVNGGWSSWNSWGTCSRSCGNGYRKRTRLCNNPSPSVGGNYCSGDPYQIESCRRSYCHVNGRWSSWNSWNSCSRSCGNGYRKRIRYCDSPRPSNGGSYCSGDSSQINNCHKKYCQVDGKWGSWSAWGQCDVTCGDGQQQRTRSCTSPAPAYGGSNCKGNLTELQSCSLNGCPVNGGWGSWNGWGSCSRSCGNGYKKRIRKCKSPIPSNGGTYCSGDGFQIQNCHTKSCKVHGKWGSWSEWGQCDVTCGNGKQRRTRSCTSPAPAHRGSNCNGNSTELQPCSLKGCPVNGDWSLWTSWGTCSRSCGNGFHKRTRTCNNPSPSNGGPYCSGDANQIKNCRKTYCPVDGKWGSWSDWGQCNVTCGGGKQRRTRSCTSPTPAHGGSTCNGNSIELQSCSEVGCPVNGIWSEWSAWKGCSVSCGGGLEHRQRICDNPIPQHGGQYCKGTDTDTRICSTSYCPVDGKWGSWSEWGQCDITCGGGQQQRTRSCTYPAPAYGGSNCNGNSTELQSCSEVGCPVNGIWSEWSAWKGCSVSCGGGLEHRQRICDNPIPQHGGQYCKGTDTDTRICCTSYCPVDGKWGSWSEWGQCDVTCGGGQQRRTRSCTSPAPAYGGSNCNGNSTELQSCSAVGCPVNGIWSEWSKWKGCSVSCGGGLEQRQRICDNPLPLHGGQYCNGTDTDIRICSTAYCPVDGNWGEWSDWGPCNDTCGSGTQTRYRQCDDPSPYFGGITCAGLDSQIKPCNDSICPSNAETKYSFYVVVSASGGGAIGTLLLVVFGICASKITCSKRAKKERLSGQNTAETTEGTYRQNDNNEIYELPCHSAGNGTSDECEYMALTCDNTIITSETFNNDAYGLQSVEDEEDQNVYENY